MDCNHEEVRRRAHGRQAESDQHGSEAGLRAERIGHGLSCLADPGLVAYLRESQVPLEVCPTSNVCTRQVPDLASHPLPRLLADGLFVTLNSDDPPMFGTSLTQEYRQAASVLGLSRDQLASLARNGVRASFLDAAAKQALLAEIDDVAGRPGDAAAASAETGPGPRQPLPIGFAGGGPHKAPAGPGSRSDSA